jgi:adhesin transport system outer membrane protein
MIKPIFTPVVMAAIFFCGIAGAQPANSLKDSVERAILNNPEIKFKRQNVLAITSEQDAAKGAWLPRVDLSMASGIQGTTPSGSDSRVDFVNSTINLQLRQVLFDGFATDSNVRRLAYTKLAAYYDLLFASDQIALETVRAYIDVLRYRELVTLARENYDTHHDLHIRVDSRVTAGVGRRVDLEQATGRMALAKSNWLTEMSNLHDVSERFERLVGEAPANTLLQPPSLTQSQPSRDNFIVNTVRNNSSFLGAVANIRAHQANAKLQESPNYPSLELVANSSVEKNRLGVVGQYRNSGAQFVLNYNLFRGGSDSARARQYAAKLNSAFDLRDKTCRDVRQTALIALNDVTKLEIQIRLLAQHELSTFKAREAYRQQFDLGQRSLLDLLDTENELFQSRRALTNAKVDFQMAQAQVLTVNGSLLPTLQLRPIQSGIPNLTEGTEVGDDELLCDTKLPEPITFNTIALPSVSAPFIKVAEVSTPLVILPTAPNNAICESIIPAVDRWISAWNKKDVNGYFAAYSDAFKPAQGLTHARWEALRKMSLNKQGDISVELTNITQTNCNSKTSQVNFTQRYDSVGYRDTIEKMLSMEYANGQWRIIHEAVIKGRTF